MPTETDAILDMIDSIEEAIVQDAPWSTAPPEGPQADATPIASEAPPAPSVPPARALPVPPSEPRSHQDPPPRSVAWVPRVSGSTAEVLARFKWGDR